MFANEFRQWLSRQLKSLQRGSSRGRRRSSGFAVRSRPHLEALEDRCVPATSFTVNTFLDTVDANPGDGLAADADGKTSLRAAIMEANATAGDDTIILPAGTYNRTLDGSGDKAGDLDIKDSLTLTGAGAATTIIDAGGLNRVLEIIGAIPVGISGVTIRNGNAGVDSNGGGVRLDSDGDTAAYTVTFTDCVITGNTAVNGGGISNLLVENNSLVLVRTTVSNNTASTDGGGIVFAPASGSLTLTDSIVRGNKTGRENGGILFAGGQPSVLTITGSTISGNSAPGGIGGGITWFGSAFVMTNSTVSGNTAGAQGGGIITVGGNVTMTNCTISGNTAGGNGGGIDSQNTDSLSGPYTLINVTITNNVADSDNNGTGDGGGIFNRSPGTISLLNTIVGGNSDSGGQAPDCSGTITSQGHNLIQSTLGCTITGDTTGNITGQDPRLGSLNDNGGPTFSHLLLAGSPAIDAGTSTGAPATDQRGISRPQGAGVDIGAVEVVAAPTGTADLKVEKTAATPSIRAGAVLTYAIVVTNLSSAGAADVVLTDAIPANTTFVSLAAPTGWTVQAPAAGATGTIVATLANLGPGASATFQLSVRVAPDAAPPTSINNSANVTAATEDPNPANNSAPAVVAVEAAPPVAREQRLTFKLVSRSAAFRNELGLFRVDSADGRIGNLQPGDPGYAAAALARRRVLFRRNDGAGTIRRLTLPAGTFFGLYLVQNGSSAEVVARNHNHSPNRRPQVFFSFTAANRDRFAHVRWLSARQFAFEDLTGGGDRDFNDLVARFSVAAH